MANFAARVTAPAAFAAPADITIPFEPKFFTIVNEDTVAANFVEWSYDGVNVAGRLTPGINAFYRSEQRAVRGIWLRRGAGTPAVDVIAEG